MFVLEAASVAPLVNPFVKPATLLVVLLLAVATVFVFTGAGIGGKILLVIGNHAARNASEITMIMRDLRSIESCYAWQA